MNVTYDESKNPDQAALPGVPLATMSAAEFQALPLWLQVSVCACPFYTVPAALVPVTDVPPGTPMSADIAPVNTPTDEVINDG